MTSHKKPTPHRVRGRARSGSATHQHPKPPPALCAQVWKFEQWPVEVQAPKIPMRSMGTARRPEKAVTVTPTDPRAPAAPLFRTRATTTGAPVTGTRCGLRARRQSGSWRRTGNVSPCSPGGRQVLANPRQDAPGRDPAERGQLGSDDHGPSAPPLGDRGQPAARIEDVAAPRRAQTKRRRRIEVCK